MDANQVIKVRSNTVERIAFITNLFVVEAILLFIYNCYIYLFYSADCNPRNGLSLEANSLLTFIGRGTSYLSWPIFIVCYFWPSRATLDERNNYKIAR